MTVQGKKPARERLDVILHSKGLAPSREKAQAMILAGLVMSGVETIQPGSFEPLDIPLTDAAGQNNTVLVSAPVFAQINYFAFICLTTVGFGDINPELPLARMLAVSTGIAGPLYLAVVMGVLIGRYSGDREIEERLEQHNPDRR